MNVDDGEIIAMGSSPSFDPAFFTKPFTTAEYQALVGEDELAGPLFNRAIAGAYPTGSTFKLITSVAALRAGEVTPEEIILDDGAYTLGGITFQNAGGAVFGSISMQYALQVSSDVFYYTLGDRMNGSLALQRWSRRLGIGEPTGIDLPLDSGGLLPTPNWRDRLFREGAHRPALVGGRQRQPLGRPGRPAGEPAADGGRLRDDRQRRHGRAAAPRAPGRGRGRPRGAGGRPLAGAEARDRPSPPAGDHGRPPRRRAVAGRHLLQRLRRLPGPGRRARRAPPSARPTGTSPGTWSWRPTPTPGSSSR